MLKHTLRVVSKGKTFPNRFFSTQSTDKLRLLTGDTPTGPLHLGHWTGSLEQRVLLQDKYQSFFIIANTHALTTMAHSVKDIKKNTLEIAIDYLSCGIDPKKSSIFLQSDVPAIFELTFLFSMYTQFNKVLHNPTIKTEIRTKGLGDNYPFGFLLYPIGQAADILAFRPHVVPVGEDQIPHIELTNDIAKKLNKFFDRESQFFPKVEPIFGKARRLVGLGGPSTDGHLLKMSKSLNNAIYLKDPPDIIRKKIMGMYTASARIHQLDKRNTSTNPLWIFLETFCENNDWLVNAKNQYQQGLISDVECKKRLIEIIVELTNPMRKRRLELEANIDEIHGILREGSERANNIANDTLDKVKDALNLDNNFCQDHILLNSDKRGVLSK